MGPNGIPSDLLLTGVSGVAPTSRDDGDPNRSRGRIFNFLFSFLKSVPYVESISIILFGLGKGLILTTIR
jgi:hypothetical protein